MKKIESKITELQEKYNLSYKEAEYLACRLISQQTIPHIKARLEEKLHLTLKKVEKLKKLDIKSENILKQIAEYTKGITKSLSLIKFLQEREVI